MKRILTIGAFGVIIGLIAFQLFRNKKKLESANVLIDRSHLPVAVNIVEAKIEGVSGSFSLPASLAPVEQVAISTSASGMITSLKAELGTMVRKGQIIGTIDIRETEQKLKVAELSLADLTSEYERNKILLQGNAINAKAVTDAKLNMESKASEVAQLKTQLGNATITSPINGIVSEKQLSIGEFVNAGTVIATVVNIDELKANVLVPESKVFTLKAGQKVAIIADAFPTESFSGIVTFITPQGDTNHNYLVQLLVNNKSTRLKGGQYVKVNFSTPEVKPVLQIPQLALVDGIKNPYVYVIKDSIAVEQKILLGRELGESVEVLNGLSEGDQVVINGQINLVNGSYVNVIR